MVAAERSYYEREVVSIETQPTMRGGGLKTETQPSKGNAYNM